MLPVFLPREWWDEHQTAAVLVDVRRSDMAGPGSALYEAGHLPGATYVDLDAGIAGPPSPERGRHPLPEPDAFAETMAAAGIGDEDAVVAYDDADGVIAARLVWMLRVTGHDAALLDGGVRPGQPGLEQGPVRRPRARFVPRPWPRERLADADDASTAGNVVLDARSRERYLGAVHPLDPRPGHIPGARSLPCLDSLDENGRLLPDDQLRRRLLAVGVTDGPGVVSSCGSGVTACHTLLVMEHVDLGQGRLYPGSWSEYAGSPGRPAELGDGVAR